MNVAQSLLAFSAAAGVVTLTPGLDTALVLRVAAAEGRRAGAKAALGVATGCLTWGAMVALGLTAVLAASHLAYEALKWAGALYLLWLGVGLIVRPRASLDLAGGARSSGGAPFRRGLLTNLLNPKAGVFYVSFLPQFLPPGVNPAAWTVLLAGLHGAMGLAWFAVLIAGIGRARRWLSRQGVVRALDRATGAVFIGFGVRLALDRGR